MKKRMIICLAAVAVFLGVIVVPPGPVRAAPHVVWNVKSTLDEPDMTPGDGKCKSTPSNKCTLRAAIMEMNASGASGKIVLPAGTFMLTHKDPAEPSEDTGVSGDLDIHTKLTLKGKSKNATFIDGAQNDRVFDLFAKTKIAKVTIQHGLSAANGGGINVEPGGTLKLRNSIVTENEALDGSGIYGGADLTLNNSTIWYNACLNYAQKGGGVYIAYGGYIGKSRISNNCADQGGGIFATDAADVRLDIIIVASTVDSNRARQGGGLYTETGGYALNSTFTANRANLGSGGTGEGGAIYDSSVIEDFAFYNLTVASNSAGTGGTAGGIYVAQFENADLKNTILDTNTPDDCQGAFTSLGFNLIYNPNGCALSADLSTQTGIHADLMNLASNGGPTPTMALKSISEALDAIPVANCTWGGGNGALTTDQRGEMRPADGDGNGKAKCDIGAYELQP